VRAIERKNVVKNNRTKIRDNTVIIGIDVNKDELMHRITTRAEQMFRDELYNETKRLTANYSLSLESMKSNVYPIVHRMLNGEISRDEAIQLTKIDDWHLAKKQLTWFRRNPHIKWLPPDDVEHIIFDLLSQT
jgi:tRNA dimethylallyltransferase